MTFVHRIWRLGFATSVLIVALAAISPAIAANAGVSIVGKKFDPPTIAVAQGDTVTWTVTESIGEPHTVTSGFPNDPDKGLVFDSAKTDPNLTTLTDNGGTFSFTFDTPGTYLYFCTVHPTMRGQVTVLAPGQTAPPLATPTAAPAGPTAGPTSTAAPAATGEPSAGPPATAGPATASGEGIPPERKLIGAAILGVTLVVLFGAAMLYRRMNPA